jgi:cytoskeletal protein CcmA (bactofilin family)
MANRESGHNPETIIAAGVQLEGDFTSQGNVLIEGSVQGSLRTERDLRVGENAVITADVKAANAVVAGEVRGNVVVSGKLELETSARVFGDIKTGVLVVASGATLNGQIKMGAEETAASTVRGAKVAKAGKSMKADDAAAVETEDAMATEKEEEKRTVNAFFR